MRFINIKKYKLKKNYKFKIKYSKSDDYYRASIDIYFKNNLIIIFLPG